MDKLIGQVLQGRYRITEKIGGGGMGAVYAAWQEALGREVAVKVVRPAVADIPETVARFEREARIVARLNHPNIVTVHDFGTLDSGGVYLVMERLRGESLAALLRRQGALAWPHTARVVRDVARALVVAHKEGIIHRDLKPENVMLVTGEGEGDFVKVLDFGVAKLLDQPADARGPLTGTGMLLGTPGYMAPEVVMDGVVTDPRSDLYALGLLWMEALTGAPVYQATTPAAVLVKQVTEPPPDVDTLPNASAMPPQARRLLASLVDRDPAARPPDAASVVRLLDDLERTLGSGTQFSAPLPIEATSVVSFDLEAAATQPTPAPSSVVSSGTLAYGEPNPSLGPASATEAWARPHGARGSDVPEGTDVRMDSAFDLENVPPPGTSTNVWATTPAAMEAPDLQASPLDHAARGPTTTTTPPSGALSPAAATLAPTAPPARASWPIVVLALAAVVAAGAAVFAVVTRPAAPALAATAAPLPAEAPPAPAAPPAGTANAAAPEVTGSPPAAPGAAASAATPSAAVDDNDDDDGDEEPAAREGRRKSGRARASKAKGKKSDARDARASRRDTEATDPGTGASTSEVQVEGNLPPALTSALIDQGIQASLGSASACRNTNIKRPSSGPGLLVDHCPSYQTLDEAQHLIIKVKKNGEIVSARFRNAAANDSPIGACITKSIKGWRFPEFSFDGEEPVTITQKVRFKPCVPINNKCVF